MRDSGSFFGSWLPATAGLLLVFAATGQARAETWLIKGGGKVYGHLEKEHEDDHGQAWLTIRTTYGRVDIPKEQLKRKLKSEKTPGTLYVDEARVYAVRGTAQISRDKGESWHTIPWDEKATRTEEFPFLVRAGELVRTEADSGLDLDLGWGLLVLDAESEVELAAYKGATIRLRRGRVGGNVEPQTTDRRFRVETPQATMAVRGTVFSVAWTGDASRLSVLEGEVEVGDAVVAAEGSLAAGPDGHGPGDYAADERFLEGVSNTWSFPKIDWVVIPGGEFQRLLEYRGGTTSRIADADGALRALERYFERTQDVRLRPYLMSRTEVTIEQLSSLVRWADRHPLTVVASDVPSRRHLGRSWKNERYARFVPPEGPPSAWPAHVRGDVATFFARWMGARLPSDSEWEFAARADGHEGRGTSHLKDLNEIAWTIHNSGDGEFDPFDDPLTGGLRSLSDIEQAAAERGARPRLVGQLRPNEFGLFDVFGNVDEWVSDAFVESIVSVPADGGPVGGASAVPQIIRGGDYRSTWADAGVWYRLSGQNSSGIRLVRSLRD